MKKIFLFLIVFLLAVSISNSQQSGYPPTGTPPQCNLEIGGVQIDGLCYDCGADDNICPDIVLGYEHCGLNNRPTDPDCVITKTLTSISIAPTSISIEVGQTQTYTITATYSDSSTADKTTSSILTLDPTKATVSQQTLTAIASGTVTITASYTEAGITKTATSTLTISDVLDTTPEITDITTPEIAQNSAKINWTTDEDSNSSVEYGTTTSYGDIKEDASYTKYHSITITGLTANTLYHYKVCSTDRVNNKACSEDKTFTTLLIPDINNPTKGGSNPDCLYDPSDITTYNCRDNNNDLDNDGQNNNIDNDIDGDGIPNNQDIDDDNDGIPDTEDIDDDNDGILDTVDTPFPICTIISAVWVNPTTEIAYPENTEINEDTPILIAIQGTNCANTNINLKLYEVDYVMGQLLDKSLVTEATFPTLIIFNTPTIAVTSWTTKWIKDERISNIIGDDDPEFRFGVFGSDVESQTIIINKAPVVACIQESDIEFCSRLGKNCGIIAANDNCNIQRTANCGTCTLQETCEANVCGTTSCTCSSWANAACGQSTCSSTEMKQTRTCTPSSCQSESQCVSDAVCCSSPKCYLNGQCNDEGTKNGNQACIQGNWQTYNEGECGKLTCNANGCAITIDNTKCKSTDPKYSDYDYICENKGTTEIPNFVCTNLCLDARVNSCCFCYSICKSKIGIPGRAPETIDDCNSIARNSLFELQACK